MKTDTIQAALFLKISSWLTGFEEIELQGTGMTETYYQTIVTKNTQSCVEHFFEEVIRIFHDGGDDEEQTNALISQFLMPESSYNNLAQNIITMWYTGEWAPDVNSSTSLAQARNISPNAYIQGLMWPAANTHPPGAKQPGYGSWAQPPIGVQT